METAGEKLTEQHSTWFFLKRRIVTNSSTQENPRLRFLMQISHFSGFLMIFLHFLEQNAQEAGCNPRRHASESGIL
jgi:hypothetical protein